MALLPLDTTLGLAVYTSSRLYPFRVTAGVRVIRAHGTGVRQQLVGTVLPPPCPPLRKQQGLDLASWAGWLLVLSFVKMTGEPCLFFDPRWRR